MKLNVIGYKRVGIKANNTNVVEAKNLPKTISNVVTGCVLISSYEPFWNSDENNDIVIGGIVKDSISGKAAKYASMLFWSKRKNLEKKYIPDTTKNIDEKMYAIGEKKKNLSSFLNIKIDFLSEKTSLFMVISFSKCAEY